MEFLSPGFGSPELPRTQLAERLSLAPEGKGQGNQPLVQSQALAGQGERFHSLEKWERPNGRNRQALDPKGARRNAEANLFQG